MITLFNEICLPATMPLYHRLKKLIAEDSKSLDVVVVDISSLGGHLLAESSKLPTIINSPSLLPLLTTSR